MVLRDAGTGSQDRPGHGFFTELPESSANSQPLGPVASVMEENPFVCGIWSQCWQLLIRPLSG